MGVVKILYINGGLLDRGGISAYMMNYFRHIDRTKVQIDFVVHGLGKGVHDDEVLASGSRIYNIPLKSKDYFGNIRALKKIFLSGEYKIVHSHLDAMSGSVLKIAKDCGVPVRIAHSHNTGHTKTGGKLRQFYNEYARRNVKKYATHLVACSELAGRWLFGDRVVEKGKVSIIKNAIEFEKYCFNEEKRETYRKEFEAEDSFVVGHVGRLEHQKNHMFLLEIFAEILKRKANAKLILVGSGTLEEKILDKAKDLNISESVIMLGSRSDVSDILNAFDIFVFPSFFEGLSVVAVEAQANGLQCFVSDGVSKETDILKRMIFIPLENSAYVLAEKILDCYNPDLNRSIEKQDFADTGYEIEDAAKRLQRKYEKLGRMC